MRVDRVLLIVLDGVGVGEMPDAEAYGDLGSDTLGHIDRAVGGLYLEHLGRMGLGNVVSLRGTPPAAAPSAAYGRMAERSPGKDSITGHWELAGVVLDRAFPTYPGGFPSKIIEALEKDIGRRVLGNVAASGTEIIERLGPQHLATGHPIVYTSADSVFQIAAHTEVVPLEMMYRWCEQARRILTGDHRVARVIARPFEGPPGSFRRTKDRRDYAVVPPETTLLDAVAAAGMSTTTIGKTGDLFARRGVTRTIEAGTNADAIDALHELMAAQATPGLVFATLVDFDTLYGHRNDPAGYARALADFDLALGAVLRMLRASDVLIMSADHGNDPTTPSTDHSREYVPVLVAGDPVSGGVNLGTRASFADVAATVRDLLGLEGPHSGTSFSRDILR